MPDIEENYMSDTEEVINPKVHKRLLDAVGRLSKTQHIKKPTRNETALKRSEFHLVKRQTNIAYNEAPLVKDATISVPDIVKALKKTNKHLTISKELKNSERNKKILDKPLEKPVADRIQRSVGYEKAKKKLDRWNAVVTKNRSLDHMVSILILHRKQN